MTSTRPNWAEISRSYLLHNYGLLRRLAGSQTEVVAVVKANAYGNGLADCARILEEGGARWFGVTCVEEGVALRQVCKDARILIMSGLWHGEAETAIEHRLTPVVWEPPHLEWLLDATQKRGMRAGQVRVHLEFDTGMSRQGAAPEAVEPLLETFTPGSPLRLEALMTHFHSPEDREATRQQKSRFIQMADTIHRRGIAFDFLSAGSSASVLHPDEASDCLNEWTAQNRTRRMVRTGIALYGYSPSDAPETEALRPVLSWKTRVVSQRTIEAGTTVGYDATFRANRKTRLALLPVGYGDGLNRLLSNRGSVLLRGQRAPIAGRISMDHTVVDVTDIPEVRNGDEVTLIGEQSGKRITAAEMATLVGTIPYEVLCAVAARVPRVVVD